MANSIVKRKRKIGGHVRLTERPQGALCDFGKIHLLMDLEYESELGDGARQQPHDRTQYFPLFFRVSWRRQLLTNVVERMAKRAVIIYSQQGNQSMHPVFPRFCDVFPGFGAARRKPIADRILLAPSAFLCEQQRSDGMPAGNILLLIAG